MRSRPNRRHRNDDRHHPTLDPDPIDLDQGERSCVEATRGDLKASLFRHLCCAAKCDRRTFQSSPGSIDVVDSLHGRDISISRVDSLSRSRASWPTLVVLAKRPLLWVPMTRRSGQRNALLTTT
jgi:hypothetical protein